MQEGKRYYGATLEETGTASETVLRAGVALADAVEIASFGDLPGTVRGVVVPEGYRLEVLERVQARPSSKRGIAAFYDVASFCAYVSAHATTGTTIAYAPAKFGKNGALASVPIVRAVLDGHEPKDSGEGPGWGRHIADLKFETSRRLAAWLEVSGQAKTLADMTEFVEDRIGDIAEPTGSEIHDLIRRFSVNRAITFSSASNTTDGTVDLVYRETDDAAKPTTSKVPEFFTLVLPIFEGDSPAVIRVRFRYRLSDGRVAVTFKLIQIEDAIDAAVLARVRAIAEATQITPLYGSVPANIGPLS